MNDLKCEKCDSKMIYKINGHTQGWYCEKCDWGICTSYFSKFESDNIDYKVEILGNNEIDLNNLKIISKIKGCNFILSKEILLNGGNLIKDKAININDKIKTLDDLGIKYIIEPKYPYK